MKPTFSIERTNAQFQETSTTYNDPTVTYSSASQTYGGSDRKQSLGQTPIFVMESKPSMNTSSFSPTTAEVS